MAMVRSRPRSRARLHISCARPSWERMATWTFSNTDRRGKVLVRWKDRARPSRQMACGGRPVMSRPLKLMRPASGTRCPVITLKRVLLPAPLGPMIAAISPGSTRRLTPTRAWKPPKALATPETSSTGRSRRPARGSPSQKDPRQTPGEHVDQREKNDAQHDRPVFRVRRHHRVEDDEDPRAQGRPQEDVRPAEEGHEEHLGGLGPEGVLRGGAAGEQGEHPAGEPGDGARKREGRELGALDVDPDELCPLVFLPDGEQGAAERSLE